MAVDRRGWPLWVRLGLWGVPARWVALSLAWAMLAGSGAAVGYAAVGPPTLFSPLVVAGLCLAGALHYSLSARWADRHGGWS